jgi:hypothetical protein
MSLVLKMATPQQRIWCGLQLVKKASVTAVQRAFHTQFHMEQPSQVSMYAICKKFKHKGFICKGKNPDQPCMRDANASSLLKCFLCTYNQRCKVKT